MRAVLDAGRKIGLRELVEIEAGAKRRSCPGENDRTDRRVRRPRAELFGDLVAELDRERVASLRPGQGQRRDAVVSYLGGDVPVHCSSKIDRLHLPLV
jgi:hypothetical protein